MDPRDLSLNCRGSAPRYEYHGRSCAYCMLILVNRPTEIHFLKYPSINLLSVRAEAAKNIVQVPFTAALQRQSGDDVKARTELR